MKTVDLVKKYNHIFHTDYTADSACQGAWLFTEGTGTQVDDASQNTNTGNFQATGHPAWSSSIVPKTYTPYSVNFDGSTDYINFGSDTSIDNLYAGNMSVVMWIEPTTTAGYWLGKISSANYQGWVIFPTGTNAITFWKDWDGTNVTYNQTANSSYATGNWYHIATTCTSSFNPTTIHIYINGVEASYQANSTGIQHGTDASYNLVMGDASSGDKKSDAYFSETGLFNRVLTSTEINDIMDNGLKPSGGTTYIPPFQHFMSMGVG